MANQKSSKVSLNIEPAKDSIKLYYLLFKGLGPVFRVRWGKFLFLPTSEKIRNKFSKKNIHLYHCFLILSQLTHTKMSEETKSEQVISHEETAPVAATEEATKASNVVSDASKLPTSSIPEEILKQVEFYFSDQNLPNDRFLYTTAKSNDGWVPISTIACFSRMRRFQPFTAIVEALKQSKELLEVSEDNELVRRKIPLEEPKPEQKKNAFDRSIYAKGFGEETETTQFDLEKFFETFGAVKQVRLRRSDDKKFKGSVFVEFEKIEDADAFLALDPKPKYEEKELLAMSKKGYVDMKAAEHGFSNTAKGRKPKFNAFKEQGGKPRGDFKGKRRNDSGNNRSFKKRREDKDEVSEKTAEAVPSA